jgi:thiamine-phosphate pyrophosphorylase
MKSLVEKCLLYGILDTSYLGQRDPCLVTSQMIEGGVDIIQLRAKGLASEEVLRLAKLVSPFTREAGVPLIINDHPEVALEVDADGVHVGQADRSIDEVRKMMGPDKIVGKSTHSLAQALEAQGQPVDYIGVGPVFATPTKPDYLPVGLQLVRQVTPLIKIPFFCIGGIKRENAAQVLEAGARRFVVVSGILQADDIVEYCSGLKSQLSAL